MLEVPCCVLVSDLKFLTASIRPYISQKLNVLTFFQLEIKMSVLCFLLLVLSAQALDEVKVNSLARRPIPANLFGIFFEVVAAFSSSPLQMPFCKAPTNLYVLIM
jgi:hypothetical protein